MDKVTRSASQQMVKICEIKHRNVADKHEPGDVKCVNEVVSQSASNVC